MTSTRKRLFKNTQEAISFGEKASLNDMSVLLRQLVGIMISKIVDISFEMQFYNEAYHAYTKDEWYKQYYKKSDL